MMGKGIDKTAGQLTFFAAFIMEFKNNGYVQLANQIVSTKFKPFIDLLPKSLSNFPVFYTEEELAYLDGSIF